ncbi:uncharacterized protein LOC132758142 [Ruditapes philippinarum]|uniref:uncharacterized protein LOC132758142 n=1 Tax=Ruditapes philippinarum TaxID=129788 RepID=UPI00295C1D69|nr:uncharacterized protein LOC132758142 [Ruditapes philippinarum]
MSWCEHKWRVLFASLLACSVLITSTVYRSYSSQSIEIAVRQDNKQPIVYQPDTDNVTKHLTQEIDPTIFSDPKTKDKVTSLAKIIYSAKKHVRGSKTSDYLKQAILVMDSILKDLKVNTADLYERQSVKFYKVCAET